MCQLGLFALLGLLGVAAFGGWGLRKYCLLPPAYCLLLHSTSECQFQQWFLASAVECEMVDCRLSAAGGWAKGIQGQAAFRLVATQFESHL